MALPKVAYSGACPAGIRHGRRNAVKSRFALDWVISMAVFVRAFALVALLACMAGATVFAQSAPKPSGMRLGDAVRPLAYDAELTIVPTLDKFTGKITIEVDISAPTRLIWLNAEHLDLHKVTLTAAGHSYVGRGQSLAKDFASLRFAQTIPAGTREYRH